MKGVPFVWKLQRVAPLEAQARHAPPLYARATEHPLGEIATDHLAARADTSSELDRKIAGAGGHVEYATTRMHTSQIDCPRAPTVVQPCCHQCVQRVIDGRHTVEHGPHLTRLQPSCGRVSRVEHETGYFSCERKKIAASNFFGGRFLNEGIGAVGLTSVRAIPNAGRREPMWVRSGPGPELPLSPILGQARQPDWAPTCLPASYWAKVCPPACLIEAGVGISMTVGEPALAPW